MGKTSLPVLGLLLVASCQRAEKVVKEIDQASRDYYSALGTLVFSTDGQLAYVAKKADAQVVVLNGQEDPAYDQILYIAFVSPAQAPDSQRPGPGSERLVYVAQKGDKQVLVDSGHEGPGFDEVSFEGVLADGRVYYVVREGDRKAVVISGAVGSFYDAVRRPVLSPDGEHIAYWATQGDSSFVVLDTVRGPAFDKLPPRPNIPSRY